MRDLTRDPTPNASAWTIDIADGAITHAITHHPTNRSAATSNVQKGFAADKMSTAKEVKYDPITSTVDCRLIAFALEYFGGCSESDLKLSGWLHTNRASGNSGVLNLPPRTRGALDEELG
jgi:hypothetical protein